MKFTTDILSGPRQRWNSPPSAQPRTDSTLENTGIDYSDAHVGGRTESPGFARMALLGLGAMTAFSGVANAEPLQPQEVISVQETANQVEVDLRQDMNSQGRWEIRGEVGGRVSQLERRTLNYGGVELSGSWNGQEVDLNISGGAWAKDEMWGPKWSGYSIQGTWGEDAVDLEVTPHWSQFDVKGSWGDQSVEARFGTGIHGTWRGEEINLERDWSKLRGTLGDGNIEVNLGSSDDQSTAIQGNTPDQAIFPILLSGRLTSMNRELFGN
jgi:hypothetical protein